MTKDNLRYRNKFSFFIGLLCFSVVYLHSNWISGFDVFSLGSGSYFIKQFISLILLTTVPSFFICWGYLSRKYLYDNEKPISFLKRKLIQFYPLYIVSILGSFFFNPDILQKDILIVVSSVLGVYYEKGFIGGNIYLPVIFVILSCTILKAFRINRRTTFFIFILCVTILKIIPSQSQLCYFKYFGYYSAFWLGIILRDYQIFESENERIPFILIVLASIGLITPVLNKFGIYFIEIKYHPNSPEQLFFCTTLIYVGLKIIDKTDIYRRKYLGNLINTIGNNAYGHFILHYFLIIMYMKLGKQFPDRLVIIQLSAILTTSIIIVYFLVIPYRKFEKRIIDCIFR